MGVRGAGSQAVLRRMLAKNLISEQTYNKALVRLIMANYKTIFVDPSILMWALEEYQLAPTPEVIRLFQLYAGPDCSEEFAILAMAQLTRSVWLNITLPQSRYLVLDLILRTLTTGRSASTLKKFAGVIRSVLRLYPPALSDILGTLQLWTRTRETGDARNV